LTLRAIGGAPAELEVLALMAGVLARGHLGHRCSANVTFYVLLTVVLVAKNVAPWDGDMILEEFRTVSEPN
jgi:hypothetical protein